MLKGIMYVIGASLIFGIIPSASKYLVLTGSSPALITTRTQTIIMLGGIIGSIMSGASLKIPPRDALRLMVVGALGMGGTSWFLVSAISMIPAGLATVLHFLYPTIVSVFMIVFLRQKAGIFRLLAVAASISGMILISGPGGGGIRFGGVVFALLSATTYAAYIIYNDVGSAGQYPQTVKLFWCALGTVLVFACLSRGEWLSVSGGKGALLVQILGGLGSLAAYYLINRGIREVGASVAAFVNMLEPVTSVVMSFLLYHDPLTGRIVTGILLVLSAVLFVAIGDRRGNA